MRKQTVWIALVGAAMFAGSWCAGSVMGQSEREVEDQIREMRQQVKELVEAGRDDEAQRVEQEIGRLQEQSHQRLSTEGGDRPDPGEAKRRLGELKRQLAELKEQGRGDEAQRVARQIDEIRQRLERSAGEAGDRQKHAPNRELQERLAGMKRRIAELKEAGRHDEADRLAQEAREMMRRAQGPQGVEAGQSGEGLEQRIGHLREAAKHLHAAGLHDVATNLIRQAEQMERAARAARPGYEAQRGENTHLARRVDELSQALREMRQQMERMEKQMQELSERIERR